MAPRLPVLDEDDRVADPAGLPRYWPVATLAAALSISERSLWRAIAAGAPNLDVVRIGKIVRVRLKEKPGFGTRCQ